MPSETADAVSALLSETKAAHGVYQTTELGGVYDQDWPRWYAAYAVDHGLRELVGHDVPAEQVAAFLIRTFAEFKAADRGSTDPWAAWTARRMTTEL